MSHLTKYSFGATSAIITCLAFIIGLSQSPNPKMSIVGSLLVIAIADNISDSLGIHIYQESDLKQQRVVRVSTVLNFLTRFGVILVFIAFVVVLPIFLAIWASIAWGLTLIVVISYYISREQKTNPYTAILMHVGVAVIVILASNVLSSWLMDVFSSA
jgi:vacuolar iron transporter family protein